MSKSEDWGSDWLEIQRKYWEGWTELSRKAMGAQVPAKSPWEQAVDQWWQTMLPAAPDFSRGFVDRLLEQGKSFFQLTEELGRALQQQPGGADWQKATETTLKAMERAFGAGGAQSDAFSRIMAFWEMPLDNWQRMVSSLSLTPGDSLRSMPHREQLDRFLSAPGLGYTRETQAQWQKLGRLALDYQSALQDYVRFFSNLGLRSVQCLREHLDKLSESDKTIESARELYDMWVSTCEESYADEVLSEQYSRVHGRLVNALMAYKKHEAELVDEMLAALNMPTQAEIRTLHERLQQMRRETKALRAAVQALNERVDSRPQGSKPPPAPAETPRKAPAKKAATARARGTKQSDASARAGGEASSPSSR